MYYYAFERHGEESLQGLAFFFGILFIVEVGLLLVFGVDYRFVEAAYIRKTIEFGYVSLPLRLLVPLIAGLAMVGGNLCSSQAVPFSAAQSSPCRRTPVRYASSAAIP